ncbi:uncharacterized protein PV09_06178 [Verruconis gallopava]|uniref:RING-type domain-containing protein n=1 Tax=Verruconis gallopava TaxID=253628 RepID=A0A0D1XJ83_9PEZI|nr:uncharacterized protein PV09_06178 [Verruconis gallopava]KIW02356.1 hypothetical protein PV09_06178 [Verruconis gallopava]
MPSHSKRNTALAFFTSYERSLLKTAWGSQSQILSRDHFLPFGSCSLCLLNAVDPVACPNGDIFCRECALNNLVAQRAEIKRLEKEWERRRKEELESEELEEAEVRARELAEFERVQAGLGNGKSTEQKAEQWLEDRIQGGDTKRKFELDEEELMRIAAEERKKVRKEMDEERKAALKHLPSFWAPSQTPDGGAGKLSIPEKPPKLNTLCPSSSEKAPHNISLKTLTAIKFTEEKSSETGKTLRSCPACRKALTNVSKGVMAIPCGHVLCKSCVEKFMKPVMTPDPHNPGMEHGVIRCYVCETNLTTEDEQSKPNKEDSETGKKAKKKKRDVENEYIKRGLVELKSEGTGFAGGGKNIVEKSGIAFQC